MEFSIALKKEIYHWCLNAIEMRMAHIGEAMAQARSASVDDTKSSAGDKYETTREMMQQELDRQMQMAHQANMQKQALLQLETVNERVCVRNGCLVESSQGIFFLGISLGAIKLPGISAYAVSVVSPLGQMFLNKVLGDVFIFNHKEYKILNIL